MAYEDYEWYLEADLSMYSGKWVAIADQKVIVSGKRVDKVIMRAREMYPGRRPFIAKVRNKLSVLYAN